MKKFKKIITMCCAAIMAVSVMSVSAFAAEHNVSYSDELAIISLGDNTNMAAMQASEENETVMQSLGNAVIVYEKDVCKQIITLNEYDSIFENVEITDKGILLTNKNETEELVPYYFEFENLADLRATYYPVYVIWHYNVRLRSTPSDANTNNVIGILDNNTYFRGHSNSGDWVYGQVLNNNLAGRVGYVHNSLLNLAPDGNPYE